MLALLGHLVDYDVVFIHKRLLNGFYGPLCVTFKKCILLSSSLIFFVAHDEMKIAF